MVGAEKWMATHREQGGNTGHMPELCKKFGTQQGISNKLLCLRNLRKMLRMP
jgi:hypothetical protein